MPTESHADPRARVLAAALLLVGLLGVAGARPLAAATDHRGTDVAAARIAWTASSSATQCGGGERAYPGRSTSFAETRVGHVDAVFPRRGSGRGVAADTVRAAASVTLAGSSVDDRPARGPPQDLR